jgi:hypothetical protein
MPVILAAWEAEIVRIVVGGQVLQRVWETPSQPISKQGGVYHLVIPNLLGS